MAISRWTTGRERIQEIAAYEFKVSRKEATNLKQLADRVEREARSFRSRAAKPGSKTSVSVLTKYRYSGSDAPRPPASSWEESFWSNTFKPIDKAMRDVRSHVKADNEIEGYRRQIISFTVMVKSEPGSGLSRAIQSIPVGGTGRKRMSRRAPPIRVKQIKRDKRGRFTKAKGAKRVTKKKIAKSKKKRR